MDEQEARMVVAHKQGCKKARLGFHLDYIEDIAKLLPTKHERIAFIAGYKAEKTRMENDGFVSGDANAFDQYGHDT